MEPTGSNTVFHVSDFERSIVGNERGHSGFPESVGSHVVSGNAECPRFVGPGVDIPPGTLNSALKQAGLKKQE